MSELWIVLVGIIVLLLVIGLAALLTKPRQVDTHIPHIVLGTNCALPTQQFVLSGSPLAKHKLISGITGSGKSRLIASMCVQLLREGIPFSLIDPHEDLGKGILETLIATGFYK